MKYCKCDGKYMAVEWEFILWEGGKYYIRSDEQKKEIFYCPFCGRKLK